MKSLNAIRVFLAPALSLMNMLLNGCETENCNSLLRTEFVLFRVHALASCSSSNEALYSDKSILWSWSHFFFFIRTYFIGEEKDLMVEVITEASVQVMQSWVIFVLLCEEQREVCLFLLILNLQEILRSRFKF